MTLLLATALLTGATACSDSTTSAACGDGCDDGQYCCAQTGTCQPIQYSCENLERCEPGYQIDYGPGPYMDEQTCQPLPLQCSCKESDAYAPERLGRFSALAAANGTLYASAYEDGFGDLVLVSAPVADLDQQTLEIVDGVPDVPADRAPDGWRGGVGEPGDDVGQDTDIVIGTDGEPLISYLDVTNRQLKVANRAGGSWSTHVVDAPAAEQELIGRYSALALIDGRPHIAYLALNLESAEAPGSFRSELRWASAATAKPQAPGDWTIRMIEAKGMSCRNLCPAEQSCVAAADGSERCVAPDSDCGGCLEEELCVAGSCLPLVADTSFAEVPRANGLWPEIVLSSSGPTVLYHDATSGSLRGALWNGESWAPTMILQGGDRPVGLFCAAVTDSAGVIHLTHQNGATLTLNYLQITPASLTPQASELVDNGVRSDGVHPVGADSAILVDASGTARVIYQDAQTADLLAVRRSGPQSWLPDEAAASDRGRLLLGGPEGYGFYSDLVQEGGQFYGSTFYYAPQASPSGGLTFFVLP